jgi:hypothetical protein
LATPDKDPDRLPPREPPPEKSFWALLPQRNFRRALFLLAALIAIVAIKRMGGFSLAKLFNDVAPARGPQKQQAQPYRHLEVKP